MKGEYQGTVTEIVVGLREYNGKTGVDIREFTQSEQYTGPTKKGLRIPADKFEEFKTLINSIQPSDIASPEVAAPVVQEEVAPKKPLTVDDYKEDEDAGIDDEGYM